MAANIGPKIGIDGEAEYRRKLQDIIQQAKTLSSEMDAVSSSFDENTSAQERATKTGEVLQKQIETQKERVAMLADMVEKSAEVTGENSSQTNKWKEALYNAQKGLNELESQTGESAEEVEDIGESFEESGDSAISFSDILNANLLSDAILNGLKDLASGAKEVADAFVNTFTESVQWADDLVTLSTQTGVSTDRLQELQYMADLTDTSVETITQSMRKLTQNMDKARTGSGDAAHAFHILGVDVQNSDGSLRDSSEVFDDVIEKLGRLEAGTTRDALVMEVFGRSAQELNPLIAVGADGMATFAQEARDMGYVLDEETLGSLLGVSDSMARITNAGDSMKRQLSGAFAPFVEEVATDVIPSVSDLAGSFGDLVSGNISMSEFVDLILENARNLVDGLKERLPDILQQGQDMVSNLTEGVNSMLPELVPMALDIVMTIVQSVLDNLPSIVQTGTVVLLSLIQGIGDQLPTLIPAVVDCILTIVDTLTKPDNIGMVVDAAIAIMEGLIYGIISAIPSLIERVPEIILQFVGAILSNLPKLLESGIKMILELVAGIIRAIPSAVKGIGSLLTSIKDALFGNGGAKFRQWGSDMISGIVNGIKNSIGKVRDAAKSVANTISSWLHFSRPDIGPLRDYESWMPDMVDGMIRGIRQGEAKLDSAMYSLTAGMADSAGFYGRGGTVNNLGGVTINVNAAEGQDANAIANAVMDKMQRVYDRRSTVWA